MRPLKSPSLLQPFHNAIVSPRRKSSRSPLSSQTLLLLVFIGALLLVSCGGGGGGGSSSSGPPPQPTVIISPQTVTLGTNQSFVFNVGVQNASSSAVSWQVDNVPGGNPTLGTVTSSGAYNAPSNIPTAGAVTVTAVLQLNSSAFSSATVTIVAPLTVKPSITSLTTSQTLQLQASGPNITNTNVNWFVDNVSGGNSSTGVITSSGLYAPPATAGNHTITATSNTVPANSAAASVAVTNFLGNFSWRNDNSLTGQNRQELALTPATLAGGRFGKVSACSVDGYVLAQPLYVANSNIIAAGQPNVVHHNVVYVATEHGSVYAFDADAAPCQQIWQVNFVNNLGGALQGISTIPACAAITVTCASNDVGSNEISPEISITGTPVIATSTGTLYVVAVTKENGGYAHRLHALDIATGSEKFGGPVIIQATVPGVGDGSHNVGGVASITFDALRENQRPALLLSGGKVYVAYGSFENNDPFHGWLLAYNGTTLAQVAAFNSTPNGSRGGISESGAAAAADVSGNIFVASGNGTFNPAPTTNSFAQTLLRMATSVGLAVNSYFTPFNQAAMTSSQIDLGSSGVLLLSDQAGSTLHPHLAILGSPAGALYLLDRDNLGGYSPGGPDKSLQQLNLPGGLYGTPALWQGALQPTIYTAASGDSLKAFTVANGALSATPSSQSSAIFGAPGASPVISSFGSNSGIVWLLDTSGYGANGAAATPAVLHAYDAVNLSQRLYNSSVVLNDAAGPAVKLTVPTVANGKVYVGTRNELSVYGFLP